MATRKNPTPTAPTPTAPTAPTPTAPTPTAPTAPTDPTRWVKPGTNPAIIAALDLAADLADLANMDDSAACGGSLVHCAVRVLHKVGRENEVVWAYPVNVMHTRITPCKYHGGTPTACPDWYVAPGKSGNVYCATDPTTGRMRKYCKADRKGNPVPVRMSLDRYFTDHIKPTMQGMLMSHVMRDNPDWTDPAIALRDWTIELKAESIVR